MKPINLFLMDISHAGRTSGVDRYMESLIEGLKAYSSIQIHRIQLKLDNSIIFHREEQMPYYKEITIPLPQQSNEIMSQKFWMDKYSEQVYRITRNLFEKKENCIIHIHTLNLIDLAKFIRSKTKCKIITHLHCIPWKGLFNSNINKFNELYNLAYISDGSTWQRDKFVMNICELSSYTDADRIICVTRCAKDFLEKIMAIPGNKISVVPNGISDSGKEKRTTVGIDHRVLQLIYVGILSESKGLKFILGAMQKARQKGCDVMLNVAGKIHPLQAGKIKEANKELHLNFLGQIPFAELINYYTQSDAGIIASLQEQSSYAAIEMAMFGLPIITTAVDGLDEMFADDVNALKTRTHFTRSRGLSADTEQMAERIIALANDRNLRIRLGKNARQLYESKFTLKRMAEQTVQVYLKILEEEQNYE